MTNDRVTPVGGLGPRQPPINHEKRSSAARSCADGHTWIEQIAIGGTVLAKVCCVCGAMDQPEAANRRGADPAKARATPVVGTLFIDGDGDVCIADGRADNLVFCPATREDGTPLCPDVVHEIVRRFNADHRAAEHERDRLLDYLSAQPGWKDRAKARLSELNAMLRGGGE